MPKKDTPDQPLSPKQEMFVKEYLVDLNATQAAIRAGYSPKTAKSQGQRLLTNVDIQREIDKAKAQRIHRVEVKADTVLQELLHLATFDIADIIDKETGELLPVHSMPENIRRAITSLEVEEITLAGSPIGKAKKVKLADKIRALTKLGEHLKLFTQVHEVQATGLDTLLGRIRNGKGGAQ